MLPGWACDQLMPCVCVPCGSDMAIALHTPPHRAVSLALVAQALGATQGEGRLRRTMMALSTGSFSLPKGRVSSRQTASSAKVSSESDNNGHSTHDGM